MENMNIEYQRMVRAVIVTTDVGTQILAEVLLSK
jgi:hypothetical protein